MVTVLTLPELMVSLGIQVVRLLRIPPLVVTLVMLDVAQLLLMAGKFRVPLVILRSLLPMAQGNPNGSTI
jgi:hypothetical protein